MHQNASEGIGLAGAGLLYLLVLLGTGELHRGSGAMLLFGTIWSLQAAVFVWRAVRRQRG